MTHERPIIFRKEMVEAILASRKTQTRRIIMVERSEPLVEDMAWQWSPQPCLPEEYGPKEEAWWSVGKGYAFRCPFGNPKDHLWVREAFFVQPEIWKRHHNPQPLEYSAGIKDRAEVEDYIQKPSIHMPKWASRLNLTIKEIRAQRLNDVSDQDAIDEGIERVGGKYSVSPWRNYLKGKSGEMTMHCSSPRRSFMTLWESIHGARSWRKNPWVWVITFRKS